MLLKQLSLDTHFWASGCHTREPHHPYIANNQLIHIR